MYMTMWILGAIIIPYVLGSIPFGLLITRLAGLGDVRAIGSGSIGATNVMRTGKKKLGILTLLLDAGKGAAAVMLVRHFYNSDLAPLAGLCVVLGHIFPVWLRFKGGKGVATALGVYMAINWELGAIVCTMWLFIFLFCRISSLSSMMSIGFSPIAAYVVDSYMTALLCLNLAALILFTHRGNIKRLLQGTEYVFRRKTA